MNIASRIPDQLLHPEPSNWGRWMPEGIPNMVPLMAEMCMTDGVALVVACAVVFCMAGTLVVWPVAAVLPDVLDILLG